jgi:DNA phosphorothioation-dependent restriction protein DptH
MRPMKLLAEEIARKIRTHMELSARSLQAGQRELRTIFHGPPMSIMEEVFALLSTEGGMDFVTGSGEKLEMPLLLQVAASTPGLVNPPVGQSGRCDESHLLSVRSSATHPSYLVLVPPGLHRNLSVESTTDIFGLSGSANSSNATFDEWWNDAFVQELASFASENDDQGHMLVYAATQAADEVDSARATRQGAWDVLARAFCSLGGVNGLPRSHLLSLACGYPPMASGQVRAKDQIAALRGLGEAIKGGMAAGFERATQNASEREDKLALEECLAHLRSTCRLVTEFADGGPHFYGPCQGTQLSSPPEWWLRLTVERWNDLLEDSSEDTGQLAISCMNSLISKSAPIAIVMNAVNVEIVPAESAGPVNITLERKVGGGAKGTSTTALVVEKSLVHEDAGVPPHKAPVRYKASAHTFDDASMKVISLATWTPGIVVWSGLATKFVATKEVSKANRDKIQLEGSLEIAGAGRIYLDIFTAPHVKLDLAAEGRGTSAGDDDGSLDSLPVMAAGEGRYGIEIEAGDEYELDLFLDRGNGREKCRIRIACEYSEGEGTKSELERLIRLNKQGRTKGRSGIVVELDRGLRCNQLQSWMLDAAQAASSWRPLVLAQDYGSSWSLPDWVSGSKTILSSGQFLHDPRPHSSELQAPQAFTGARAQLAEILRSSDGGLMEATRLGERYLRDQGFQDLVERYLDAYVGWLGTTPDVATWCDVVLVTTLERDGRTLSREPDALMLSPLHPVRFAWHCVAQAALQEALDKDSPCPAASVFDPDCIPDLLHLPLRSAAGIDYCDFFSVECSSEYWAVLCNSRRLGKLVERSTMAPFDREFGVRVGGISTGFSSAQVGRALRDVSDLLSAKPTLGIAISSAGGAADACNEGLFDWCQARFGPPSARNVRDLSTGPRSLQVFDTRVSADARPDDATIAALSEDTGNAVRWFKGRPRDAIPDLGIIAQLDTSDPDATNAAPRSAISAGALVRHRVRRQLTTASSTAFVSESRQALPMVGSGDTLADKVAHAVVSLENMPKDVVGMLFAPNVLAVHDMLEREKADFVAVSSSSIDPSCFLGQWLEGAYLWDYDLPSYSQRAGDTNGYYLLSKPKQVDKESLNRSISRLPGCDEVADDALKELLLEVARRGIPTVKGIARDGTGGTGSLGMFVAVRLLQDRFRTTGEQDSLLPIVDGTEGEPLLSLVIPVDPFREHLEDLAKGLGSSHDGSLARPDLVVACIRVVGGALRIRLTPVEVKFRQNLMGLADRKEALAQAQALSKLLAALQGKAAEGLLVWRVAFRHLLMTILGFGLRVYSQQKDVQLLSTPWSDYHQQIAQGLLSESASIEIDPSGRLILIEGSTDSQPSDSDGDGFQETLVLSMADAGRIVEGDPGQLYDAIRSSLGSWRFYPESIAVDVPVDESGSDIASEPPGRPASSTAHDGAPTNPGINANETHVPSESPVPTVVGAPAMGESATASPQLVAKQGVDMLVGATSGSFEPRPIHLNLSDTRLNQLNIGVVGDLGTGKTQLLKSLIFQVSSSTASNRGIRPRILIFDYKKDYESEDFVKATGAKVVKPYRLPLNLFDTSEISDSPQPWLDRFRFFADVLDKIYSNIGPVQRQKLKNAVRGAYEACEAQGRDPTIYDVHAEYKEQVGEKSDSPLAIIDDLVDMEVFTRDPAKAVGFDAFFDGVVVISLASLGQDDRTKNLLVAVMLNMFYEYMLRVLKRPFLGSDPQLRAIDSYLLIDEADNIMKYEFDVLRKVLLQGREFGAGVILASQYLRHFKVNGSDYRDPLLTWFIHKVPNATATELGALGFTGDIGRLAENIKVLPNHHCLFKSYDSPGLVMRGKPFYELLGERNAKEE